MIMVLAEVDLVGKERRHVYTMMMVVGLGELMIKGIGIKYSKHHMGHISCL